MKEDIFHFYLGRTRITVSFWFLVALTLFVLFDYSFLFSSLFAVVLLHEGTHILFLRLFRTEISSLRLLPFGVRLECSMSQLAKKQKAVVFLSAPAVNLVSATIAYALWGPSSMFGVCSLCLGAFNLLPVPPLDGGNALAAWNPTRWSEKYQGALKYGTLLAVGVPAIWIAVEKRNLTLVICLIFLALSRADVSN